MSHTFIAHSALGDQLEFRSMTGLEKMGDLFKFQVRLLSQTLGIPATSMLGTDLTIEIDLTTAADGTGTRYLSGQVTAFNYVGTDGDFYAYQATVRPWLWLATRRTDFKIFQNMTVPDIVQEVLAPYGFAIDNKLCETYRTWEYCVQYGETDFNFISRLLEHEGAYYYFSHQLGSHSLVLADDIGSHSPLPNGPTTIPYYNTGAEGIHDEDYIDDWAGLEDIASGRYTANDYDFTQPLANLSTLATAQPGGYSWPPGAYNQQPPGYEGEVFNWPGGYTSLGDGNNYANVRIEQLDAERQTVSGSGDARNMAPGYLFTLDLYPDTQYNKQYLIESAHYNFIENELRSAEPGTPTTYRIDFTAISANLRYRVQPHTYKPRTIGPQTAIVVGPAGEEIWTDQYGRIKVQFQWDRYGQMDENSSCWIRVSQSWAGANYGSIHIPRIGQEVIVDFLNGDPDFPIITGRVYNAVTMPPWDLPANKTQSGIKTKSSKNGTPGHGVKDSPGTANAILFEDMAGQEQLWFHAQKDQLTEVENNEDKWVGSNRNKTIDGNETNVIHQNRTETVDLDETIAVHQNRSEAVDLNEQVTIGLNQQHTVGINSTNVVGSNQSDTVGVIKTQAVGVGYIQNTGIFKMNNTGIAYNVNTGIALITNTGLMRMDNVGLDWNLNALGALTATAGGALMINAGTALTATAGGALAATAGGAIAINAGAAVEITGQAAILLQCGPSLIALTPAGIIIKAPLVAIN